MSDSEKPRTKREYKLNAYDDEYVRIYTNNPKQGRTKCLIEAGYTGNYAAQEASRIHKRLADRIHEAFTNRIKNLEGKAIQNIEDILDTDIKEVGYSNMKATCQLALDYAGRKPGDVVTIKQEKTIDDIDNEINRLTSEIAKSEGKPSQTH